VERSRLEIAPCMHFKCIKLCDVMLIQVRLRGCGGVRSRRRHPQREPSHVLVDVIVERDPASISRPSVGIRGVERRCGHARVEKVRTNALVVDFVVNPGSPSLPPLVIGFSLSVCSELLLLFAAVVFASACDEMPGSREDQTLCAPSAPVCRTAPCMHAAS